MTKLSVARVAAAGMSSRESQLARSESSGLEHAYCNCNQRKGGGGGAFTIYNRIGEQAAHMIYASTSSVPISLRSLFCGFHLKMNVMRLGDISLSLPRY